MDKTADFWTQGARTLTDRLPGLPQIDLIPAVERYFDFVQGTAEINRRLTIKLAGAAGTLSEMVRDRAESAGSLAREKAELSDQLAKRQLPKSGNIEDLIEHLVEADSTYSPDSSVDRFETGSVTNHAPG